MHIKKYISGFNFYAGFFPETEKDGDPQVEETNQLVHVSRQNLRKLFG